MYSLFTRSYHFKSIDSTQNYLKTNFKKCSNMTFVSADFQTAGKGRTTRTWISEKNTNLLFSFLIKDAKSVQKFTSLSILSAICVKKALDKLGLNNVSIKWPNDVYVNGKKICGILLEGVTNNNHLDGVIIGIGLNVNQDNFPNDLLHCPTSIKLETGKEYPINKIRKLVFNIIRKEFKDIENNNYLEIARKYNYLKDKEVYCEINNAKQLVKVIDISDDNELIVTLDNQVLKLNSGEVSFHL